MGLASRLLVRKSNYGGYYGPLSWLGHKGDWRLDSKLTTQDSSNKSVDLKVIQTLILMITNHMSSKIENIFFQSN